MAFTLFDYLIRIYSPVYLIKIITVTILHVYFAFPFINQQAMLKLKLFLPTHFGFNRKCPMHLYCQGYFLSKYPQVVAMLWIGRLSGSTTVITPCTEYIAVSHMNFDSEYRIEFEIEFPEYKFGFSNLLQPSFRTEGKSFRLVRLPPAYGIVYLIVYNNFCLWFAVMCCKNIFTLSSANHAHTKIDNFYNFPRS